MFIHPDCLFILFRIKKNKSFRQACISVGHAALVSTVMNSLSKDNLQRIAFHSPPHVWKTICTNQNNAHKYSNCPRCLFGACKKILRRATVGGSRDVFFITISPLECKFCTAVQAGGLNNSCKWVEVNSFEAAFHWNGSQSPRFPSCS